METYILITYIFIDFCKSNTELLSSEIHVRHEKKPPQKNAWLTSSIVNIPQKSSLKPFILWEQPSTAQVAEVTKKKKKWKFCNKLKHLREELGKSTKRIPLKLDEKKTLTGFFKSYPASWNYHLTNLNAKFKWLFDQCPPLDSILFMFCIYLFMFPSFPPLSYQNGQTQSNNSSATAEELFEWVWRFCTSFVISIMWARVIWPLQSNKFCVWRVIYLES